MSEAIEARDSSVDRSRDYDGPSSVEIELHRSAPSPWYPEVRAFEGIAEVVSESPVKHVLHVELDRAADSIPVEERQTGREIEDCSRLDTPAREIDQIGSRSRFQLLEPVRFNFQRHSAFVAAGKAQQQP